MEIQRSETEMEEETSEARAKEKEEETGEIQIDVNTMSPRGIKKWVVRAQKEILRHPEKVIHT